MGQDFFGRQRRITDQLGRPFVDVSMTLLRGSMLIL